VKIFSSSLNNLFLFIVIIKKENMIKKFKQSIITAVIFTLAMPAVILAESPSMPPILVFGTVTINGEIASSGTVSVEGGKIITPITDDINSEGNYSIQVPYENNEEILTFKVNDKIATRHIVTSPTHTINLSITTTTDGGVSSGGGAPSAPPANDKENKDDQTPPKIPVVKGVTTINIIDGDIIRNSNVEGMAKFDVYIVKIVGDKKFRRLVLSPHVFESYGHLEWKNIKEVNQETMGSFAISNLVRCQDSNFEVNDPKVYQLAPSGDKGTKHWMNMSAKAFQFAGYDWDAIYIINKTDRDAYITGKDA